jgi:hypothetical protein
MRIRINLLALLRSLVKIAASVQTVGELVLAAHGTRGTDGGELDLDSARAAVSGAASSASSSSSASSPAPEAPAAADAPATGYPHDPSAAH